MKARCSIYKPPCCLCFNVPLLLSTTSTSSFTSLSSSTFYGLITQKKIVHLQRGSKTYNDQFEQPGTYSTGKKHRAVVQMSLYVHRPANKPFPFCKHGKFSIIVELKTKVKVILLICIATDVICHEKSSQIVFSCISGLPK